MPGCVQAAAVAFGATIAIDSMMWRRLLWPEGELLWFNLVPSKMHATFRQHYSRWGPATMAPATPPSINFGKPRFEPHGLVPGGL